MLKGEKGDTGYGISNIQMNDDYTLTLTLENGMHFNTQSIRGEKGERGACIRSAELRDDYSLLFTLDNGETIETTAILGKEFENIRKLEASASSASKIATSASTSASASAQSASQASISASESASNASTSASASAQSATNASQSATNAQESASNASTSADTATSKATEASASATKAKECEMNAKLSETNASNSAKEANTSAVNAKASEDKAKEYADRLQTSTDDISRLKEDLVANSKEDAKTKRSLSALWALNNGIPYRFETDSEKAYQKEVPSGAKLGAVNTIGGRTIVYNQYFTELSKIESNGVTITYADGVITLNGTATKDWINFSQLNEKLNVVAKFYIKMTILKNDDGLKFYYDWLNRLTGMSELSSGSESIIYSQTTEELKKASNTGIANFVSGAKFNDVKIKIIMVNLTQMFGSGNEPTTTAEFEAMFPNDYYPYNEGTLMSMSVNEVVEKGRNLFDCYGFSSSTIVDINSERKLTNSYGTTISTIEPTNKIVVTQSQAPESTVAHSNNGWFCIGIKGMEQSKKYTFSLDFTPTKMLIKNPILQILVNGRFPQKAINISELNVKKRVSFQHEYTKVDDRQYIEIRLSGMSGIFENFQLDEGSTATAYTPYYTPVSYPIPQALQNLDGYGWGVNNVYNYVDYENKKFVKRVGRVDLGTLNFTYGTYGNDNNFYIFRALLPNDIKKDENTYLHTNNLLCSKYADTPWNDLWSNGTDKKITQTSNNINITDSSFTDAETFKKSLQGVYLYYELEKAVITDISDIIGDTFQEPFNVEGGGSLTFKNTNGDGYQLAVPSDIQYVVSLKEVTS